MKISLAKKYVDANIAWLLRNAQDKKLSFRSLCFYVKERLEELNKMDVTNGELSAYLKEKAGKAKAIFLKEAKDQGRGDAAREMKDLAKLSSYYFEAPKA